jgi:choice-of-anchor A domain-containing protein
MRGLIAVSLLCASTASFGADKARDFNVVVANDFTSSGSDVEGWLAAGGNVSVGGYSIGLVKPASAGHFAAVVGGTFTGNYGTVYGDSLATSYSGPYSWVSGAAKTYAGGNSSTINIAGELTRLGQLSTDLAAKPSTYGTVGSYTTAYNQMFLVGTDTRLNVFNITAADWANTLYGWHLATKAGSLTVFNIAGTTPTIANSGSDNGTYNGQNVGFAPQGYDNRGVIYNFYQATTLVPVGSVNATILATGADFNTSYGVVQGQIFAKSFSGHIQVNHQPFRNFADNTNLLDTSFAAPGGVPEPASWALMIGGFGMIGGMVRHRRAANVSFA